MLLSGILLHVLAYPARPAVIIMAGEFPPESPLACLSSGKLHLEKLGFLMLQQLIDLGSVRVRQLV